MHTDPTDRATRITALLSETFTPSALRVIDESAQHAGHAGAAAGGQTHYRVEMTSEAFTGQGRLARARAVHDTLAGEFAAGLHALSLRLAAPGEPTG